MKSLNKNFSISLIVLLAILISQCETKDRFYRPDLPQKLCTVGIIDIDDNIIFDGILTLGNRKDTIVYSRSVSFEKSFQFEYSDELSDSLRDFSFRISNDNEDMYVYQSNHNSKNLEFKLPQSMMFESGRKYYLHASEGETPDISAETVVPVIPPEPRLLSVKTEIITLDKQYPNSCSIKNMLDALNTEIEFSFSNDNPDAYYAILLIGVNTTGLPDDPWNVYYIQWGSGIFAFNVLETNTDGFFSTIQGRKECNCYRDNPSSIAAKYDPASAYFIDGSKIPEGNCTIKLSTEYFNGVAVPEYCKSFRVRLMSIPKELYLFEKSQFTYNQVSNDPFAEPANLKGNIKGGNGVFAICRSRELIVYPDLTIKPVFPPL
jgi:hypothetical protein